jgi:hypothetical protein
MRHERSEAAARVAMLLLCLLGCGGAGAPRVNPTPLTADEQHAFDHGVDLFGSIAGLEGAWRDDFTRDLSIRVGSADLIAVVTARTLRTDTAPDQSITHRVFTEVDRVVYGETHLKQIELAVNESSPGFPSMHEHWGTLEGRQFIAYIKWFVSDAGSVAAHFHLSPATEEVLGETEALLGERLGGKRPAGQVVVHQN